MSREAFADEIAEALRERRGYAAGKLGGSERTFLQHRMVIEREHDRQRRRAFEVVLAVKALRHSGVFPTTSEALSTFTDRFAADVRRLDAIGLFPDAIEPSLEALRFHGATGRPMRFEHQEPERSSAADWLGHLRGRRVLLLCPFADLLRKRATRPVFEAVWAQTGKRWFEPAEVLSIEFPYGVAPETHERFGTALELLAHIEAQVDEVEFDVAIVAAGGLGIPLAAHVKELGRVGISLGGHLQVLFGVLGARWREDRRWRERYITDAWIDMPARYRPDPATTAENYW